MFKLSLALALLAVAANANLISVFDAGKQIFKEQTGAEWDVKGIDVLDMPGAAEFEKFKQTYNKSYKDAAENSRRLLNFQVNHLLAKAHQKMDQGTAKYGVTKFSDLSYEEFKIYYRNMQVKHLKLPAETAPKLDTAKAPASFDWRQHNAVTPVKNQEQCGSCWAFSTTGSIEGQIAISTGSLLSLSEQQIVDCDSTCYGCNGGWPSEAYQYVMQAGGIQAESTYPYYARQYQCSANSGEFVAKISNWRQVSTDEGQIATYLANYGPVSVIINAGTMQYYQGGISHPTVSQCDPSGLDHAVLAVGYGSENGTPYWIVKNSWGTTWGESGYWRVYRGGDVCGIASTVTSAVA